MVTNMDFLPEDIVKFYGKRSTTESFIKECKNRFRINNMSNRQFIFNSNTLQPLTLVYNLKVLRFYN